MHNTVHNTMHNIMHNTVHNIMHNVSHVWKTRYDSTLSHLHARRWKRLTLVAIICVPV
jgi:hypothetical protein